MEQLTRSVAAWQTYGARWATLQELVQVPFPLSQDTYGTFKA